MPSADIACTGGVRSAAQVLSPIYMIYVVSFDVVAEKKGHVQFSYGGFCSFQQGYALGNNVHNIAEGQSLNGDR